MTRYSLKRFTHTFLILIIVSSITFLISHWLPGDPAALWVGDHPTKEQLEVTKKELGLDRPIHEQYVSFISSALTLDLGVSLRTRQPVLAEISQRLSATFELVFISMFILFLLINETFVYPSLVFSQSGACHIFVCRELFLDQP